MLHWVVILVAYVAPSLQMTTTAGPDRITALSNDEEIKMSFESYPGTNWTAWDISGPEESSEFNEGLTRIINGKETSEGKYPFMVSLRKQGNRHICGGSIITPIHILTAAHCVSDYKTKPRPIPEYFTAVVGAHHRMIDASHGQTQKLEVKEVLIPGVWFAQKGELDGDIAILLLKSPIKFSKFVGPVCLTPTLPENPKNYIVMGWGVSNIHGENVERSDNLLETNHQIMDKSECHNEKEICFETDKNSPCAADSGGPYVYVDPETKNYTQVALVSYNVLYYGSKDDCSGISHGTNVVYWYDWIERIIQNAPSRHNICKKVEDFLR